MQLSKTQYFTFGYVVKIVLSKNTSDTIFETGASRVPSKSQKSFICGGVKQTITLKSPGKGAPPSTPSWGLRWLLLQGASYVSERFYEAV